MLQSSSTIAGTTLALAYFCMAALLLYLASRRAHSRFGWLFAAFALCFLGSGIVHLADALPTWLPLGAFAGLTKPTAAFLAAIAAAALFKMMPDMLRLPTREQLATLNSSLTDQIALHDQTDAALVETNQVLQAALEHERIQASDVQKRFQLTFEHAAIGLAHLAPDGRFLLVNQHFCNLVGYTAFELGSLDFAQITHPDDLAEEKIHSESLLAGKMSRYSMNKRYLHRNGSFVWTCLTASLIRDEQGEPAYFIAAVRAITEQKETERQLRQSADVLRSQHEQLQMIFEQGVMGNWTWNIARNEVTAHPIVWELYGEPGVSGPKHSLWFRQRQHPDDLPMIDAAVHEALEHSSRLDIEFRVLQPDGSVRWIACKGTVRRDGAGRPAEVFGVNFEISERKKAEAALRSSERQLRLLTDVLPQMLWLADRSGNVEFFNERWYEYTGQTPGNALSWGWKPAIHPNDLEKCLSNWRHSLASGAPYDIEYRLKSEDGSYRWHLGRALPLRAENGEVERWFGSCTDIHSIKTAEVEIRSFNQALELKVAERTSDLLASNDALLRARARLQAVLDSAAEVAIVALDNHGVIQLFNLGAEKMLRYKAAEVVGVHKPLVFLTEAECVRRAAEYSEACSREVAAADIFESSNLPNCSTSRECIWIRRDGTTLDISLTSSPMLDSFGKRVGTLGISFDITKRKLLEGRLKDLNIQLLKQTEQAQQANRAKTEFLAAMSHEIRTPMNAILGMADLLWESELDSTQRQYVDVFRRAGGNLLTLVNDILDLSKIESRQFELEKIDFDLIELVERTSEMIRRKAEAKRIALVSRITPNTPSSLVGDPTRLQQVLMNLLGNAVKFTETGSITLTVEPEIAEKGRIRFTVSDTGIGIPPDKLASIFEDFTQAESSTTRRFGGTGLGLGICRRLVHCMSGELTVQSEFGKGSTFSFDAMFEICTQEKPAAAELVNGIAGKRVLIIDNNATNRLIFGEMCLSWGMATSECDSAAATLTALQAAASGEEPFDLVILDRLMPGKDGFQLISEIREIDATIPIIMASSDRVPGDETRCRQLHLAGYAVKPVRRSDLLRMVCRALGSTPAGSPKHSRESAHELRPVPIPETPVRQGRILIAEDSSDNRFLLEAYLKNTPYEMTFAENGAIAVELSLSQNFDLILMDMQMPILDGLEATRLIRRNEGEQSREPIPILALTANARPEDIQISRDAGCTSHLSKPISKAKLLEAIAGHIRIAETPLEPANVLIDIPAGLETAAQRFIQSRKDEMPYLRQLAAQENFAQLRILAHNMKGTGSSYGFPDLTRLGSLIESSAKEQNTALLTEQLIELSKYVQLAARQAATLSSGK